MALTVTPRTTALLLMDLQNFTLAMVENADSIRERARAARRAALEAGVEVIHVRVGFTPEDHAAVPDHHKVFGPVAAAGAAADGTWATEIHADIEPAPEEHVITKTRVGALATTGLDELLRHKEIDTLVLAGVTTSGVILSTVLDAADRDYRVAVLTDVCADDNPELHRTLMDTLIDRYAHLLDTEAFIGSLGGAKTAGEE
jgi:nicotinamidase-related amidase